MVLERGYQIKVLSKQIARYSTNNNSLDSCYNFKSKIDRLNPLFITGFSDAESCLSESGFKLHTILKQT